MYFKRGNMKTSTNSLLLASLLTITMANTQADDSVNLDSLSVTATKIATGTKEVSQSIAVVDAKTIEDKNILNIQEAIENIWLKILFEFIYSFKHFSLNSQKCLSGASIGAYTG